MKAFASSLLLALTSLSFVHAEVRHAVPARDLLIAARSVIPQTGPFYEVQGTLRCESIASEVPPYREAQKCTINVQGQEGVQQVVSVENPAAVIDALAQVQPRKGPRFGVKLPFSATSVSSEFPPYRTRESAHVITR